MKTSDLEVEDILRASTTFAERTAAFRERGALRMSAEEKEIASLRLASWRRRLTIGGSDHLGHRLRQMDLRLIDAAAICSPSFDASPVDSDWLGTLADGLALAGPSGRPTGDGTAEIPFVHLLGGFVAVADARLARADRSGEWRSLSARARESALDELRRRLSSILQWCLYACFDAARSAPDEPGSYERFVGVASGRSWLTRFFNEFRGLARPVGTAIDQWVANISELLSHWHEDQEDVRDLVGTHTEVSIANFDGFPSDPHNHGRRVAIMRLSDGQTVVYKPTTGDLSDLWRKAIEFLPGGALKDVGHFSRPGHSWHRFLRSRPGAMTGEDAARLGELLAAATSLGSTDMHFENFVLTEAGPELIDHETVLSPGSKAPGPNRTFAERAALTVLGRSVLATGGLPQWIAGPGGELWNANVFGWESLKEGDPAHFPQLIEPNSDSMAISHLSDPPTGGLAGRAGGEASAEQMSAGFSRARSALREAGGRLGAEIDGMTDAVSRVVLRDTRFYVELLGHGFMPAYSRDVLDRSLLFERLYRPFLEARASPRQLAQCDAEHDALIRGDIPYFQTSVTATEVREVGGGSGGTRLAACSPLRHARRSLKAIGGPDRLANETLVLSSFEAAKWPAVTVHPVPIVETRRGIRRSNRRLELADDLFRALRSSAFTSARDESIAIVGTALHESGRTQQLVVCPPGDTYSGIAGLGLLAGALCRLKRSRSRLDIAYRSAETLLTAGAALGSESRADRFGSFAGAAGVAFAVAKIGQLIGERAYVEAAASLLLSGEPATLGGDGCFDVISGAAGALLVGGGIAIRDARLRQELRGFITRLVKALDDGGKEEGSTGGHTWSSMGVAEGVSGFAHGAAGISAALSRAHRLDTPGSAELAVSALALEIAFYSRAERGWPTIQGVGRSVRHVGSAWCYGGAGVLMGLLEAVEAGLSVDEKLMSRALRSTVRSKLDGDGLCHGEAGLALIELRAGEILRDPDLKDSGRERLDKIAERGLGRGELRLEPVSTLRHVAGLMCGASGVAVALLAPEIGTECADLLAIA